MRNGPHRLRVATWNIHKCRGFDRKTSVDRIISVIRELDADILCLQEVIDARHGSRIWDQARQIAAALPGFACAFGTTRPLRGGNYGNMTLTRLRLRSSRHHNVSHRSREERGVLQTDIDLAGGRILHVFNVHLGTGLLERRAQGQRLLSPEVLLHEELNGPRLILGDFNEWTRGLTTRLMRTAFRSFQPRHAGRFPRTFPGMLPLVTLDHCYFEDPLELEETRLWRTRTALVASDHLPLLADFRMAEAGGEWERAARTLPDPRAGSANGIAGEGCIPGFSLAIATVMTRSVRRLAHRSPFGQPIIETGQGRDYAEDCPFLRDGWA